VGIRGHRRGLEGNPASRSPLQCVTPGRFAVIINDSAGPKRGNKSLGFPSEQRITFDYASNRSCRGSLCGSRGRSASGAQLLWKPVGNGTTSFTPAVQTRNWYHQPPPPR